MITCGRCATANPADAKFCGSCGSRLTESGVAPGDDATGAPGDATNGASPHDHGDDSTRVHFTIVTSDPVPVPVYEPPTIPFAAAEPPTQPMPPVGLPGLSGVPGASAAPGSPALPGLPGMPGAVPGPNEPFAAFEPTTVQHQTTDLPPSGPVAYSPSAPGFPPARAGRDRRARSWLTAAILFVLVAGALTTVAIVGSDDDTPRAATPTSGDDDGTDDVSDPPSTVASTGTGPDTSPALPTTATTTATSTTNPTSATTAAGPTLPTLPSTSSPQTIAPAPTSAPPTVAPTVPPTTPATTPPAPATTGAPTTTDPAATPTVPAVTPIEGFGSPQVMSNPLPSGAVFQDVRASFLIAQQLADALATEDWDTARLLDVDRRSATDQELVDGYGSLDRASLMLLDARPQGNGFRLLVVSVANERSGAQTTLYCLEWSVDPVARTVDQHAGVVGMLDRLPAAQSPEGIRNDPALDGIVRSCHWS